MINLSDLSEFPEVIQKFAVHKLTIQGCSPKTVTEYLFDLRTFCRYIVAKKNEMVIDDEVLASIPIFSLDDTFFKEITESDIYDFLFYAQRDRSNGIASRTRKLTAIRVFYKFLITKLHCVETNPAANVESPKKKRQLPKHLSIEESIELLSSVKSDAESKTRDRDYCILTLFLNCGMRLSELVNININDIDRSMTSLKVLGKGSKERIIYLNEACRDALAAYLDVRATMLTKGNDSALFLSRLGKRISPKTVQWLVKKYLGEAGLELKNYSTHKLRHTAATLMYQSGNVDIRVLKDILGHEQLNTTQIYTHVSNKSMENAMNENPLSNIIIKEKKKD